MQEEIRKANLTEEREGQHSRGQGRPVRALCDT